MVSPLRPLIVTGAISWSNAPDWIAALARLSEVDRIIVHVPAGELIFVGGALGEAAHRAAFLIGVLEPVEEHVVVGGVVADARAAAMLLEQVGRVGHALHAAGDDQVGIAGGERLGAHDHRLHARSAHLVDGGRLDRCGQAGLDRGLARGGLAEAGGKHAAHVDAVDVVAVDTPARSTAALTAVAPSSVAEASDRLPCIEPIGVRAVDRMTIGSVAMGRDSVRGVCCRCT